MNHYFRKTVQIHMGSGGGKKHMQSVTKDSFTYARRYNFISKRKYFLVSETFSSIEITL
jgi:chorismate-pyruvate lyase